MRDTELYRQLLGLTSPWSVERVTLNVADERVDVFVDHPAGTRWNCPECLAECATHDHATERVWRHLDSCQFKTFLHARPPRIRCATHGVVQVKLPWAEPFSRFTALFERLAIDVLKETNVEGARRILRLSWDEAFHIQERAVARGLKRKKPGAPRFVGVDEKAIAKGQRYATLVTNLEKGTVEDVQKDRKRESLDQYFATLTPDDLASIEGIALDMHAPYVASVMSNLPEAEHRTVFDRMHVVGLLNKAVDRVRRAEHRELMRDGNPILTGSRWVFLKSEENHTDAQRAAFEVLRNTELRTAKASAIKNSLRALWDQPSASRGILHWRRWYFWATHSRIQPIIDAAKSIHRHLWGVLDYFSFKITTSMCEAINSIVDRMQRLASGIRNFDNFRVRVFFLCGGLDLYPVAPATHGNPG